MTRRRGFGRVLSGVAAAAMMLTGCGVTPPSEPSPSETSPALQTLIAAAQAEGELVWYSVPAENIAQAVSDAFTAKYGIDVKFVRATSSVMSKRFGEEAAKGKPGADLFVSTYTPFIQVARKNGWTIDLADAGIPDYPGDYPPGYLMNSDGTAVIQVQPSGLTVNIQQGGGEIDNWSDLFDPKWKGRIVMVDPRLSAAYVPFWNLMIKEQGEEFLTRIAELQPILTASAHPGTVAVSEGKGAVLLPGVQSIVEDFKLQGAPIEYVQPDASTGPEIVACLAAKAVHPNAARLFIHYLMSMEGNRVLNSFPGSATPRIPDSLPRRYAFNASLMAVSQQRIVELLGLAPEAEGAGAKRPQP